MVIKTLDLDLLQTFVLAVDMNSFAKAADRVARTQSAVSLQMQRLEEMTGHQLFIKQGRGWQLTASGDLLLGYARQLLAINHQAIQALTTTPIAGPVRLGMRIDFSESGLPLVLARFAHIYPQVQIEVTVDREEVLIQKLESGKLDVVTTFGKHTPNNAIFIGKVPLRWIGNNNKAIALQQPLPLLLFEPPCLFRDAGLEALEKVSRSWRPALTANSVAGMWAAAQAGLGIAIRTEMGLPAGCMALPAGAGLPPLPEINIFMLINQKDRSPAVKLLIDVLHDTLTGQLKDIRKKTKKNIK